MKGIRRVVVTMLTLVILMSSAVPVAAKDSLETFNYTAYADTYPDLKAAFGYDAKLLYQHYLKYGKAEGRTASFNNTASTTAASTTTAKTTKLKYNKYVAGSRVFKRPIGGVDPMPTLVVPDSPYWYGACSETYDMTDAELIASANQLFPWMAIHYEEVTEPCFERCSYLEEELEKRNLTSQASPSWQILAD